MLKTMAFAPRRAAGSACFVFLFALVACGSTVPARSGLAETGARGLSLEHVTAGEEPGLGADAGESGPGNRTIGPTDSTAAVDGGTGDTSVRSSEPNGPPAPAAERRADPIDIGVTGATNFGTFTNALGFGALDPGDAKAQAQAVITYINAQGGIHGRPLRMIFHGLDATSTDSPETQAQKTCADFTEDHKVTMAVTVNAQAVDLVPCLAKRHVPLVEADNQPGDQPFFEQYANYYYAPSMVNLTRWPKVYVDGLVAQGFLTRASRIGLVRADDPVTERAVAQSLKPTLATHGLRLDAEVAMSGVDDAASQMQGAVLRFQTEGITHVLFLSGGGGVPLLFMNAAESQNYRPRYGFTSYDAPGLLLQSTAPPAQLRGAHGTGWMPIEDVDEANDPGPVSAAQRVCDTVMQNAGQPRTSRLMVLSQLWYCDALFFTRDALRAARGLDAASVRRAVDAIGPTHLSTYTFRTYLASGRHDGAAAYRPLAYSDDCACFRYTGPVAAIGS